MDWFGLIPAVLYAGLVLVVPGYLIVRILGVRGPLAAAIAPAISIGLIGILAILLSNNHIWWLPSAFWQAVIPFWIGAIVLRILWIFLHDGADALRIIWQPRRWPRIRELIRKGSTPSPGLPRWLPTLAGCFVGGTLLVGAFTASFVSPMYFSQTNDNMFHLNVVRNILNTGDASSFTIQQLTSGGQPPSFYPGGWHAFVALVAQATSVAPIPAANAATIAVFVVVWMAGVVSLAQVLAGPKMLPVLAASVAAASMPAFPLRLFTWGGLYPNMLGIAMIPAAITTTLLAVRWWGTGNMGVFETYGQHAVGSSVGGGRAITSSTSVRQKKRGRHSDSAEATRLADVTTRMVDARQHEHQVRDQKPPWHLAQALPLIAAQGVGMVFGHPNAAFTYALFLLCVIVIRIVPWTLTTWKAMRGTPARWMPWTGLSVTLAAGVVAVMMWVWLTPNWTPTWQFSNDATTSWFEGLVDSQRGVPGPLIIAMLGLLGVAAALVRRQFILVLYYLLSVGLYVLVSSVGDPNARRFFAGIFYQDPVRVGAMLVIPSVIMATLGFVWLLELIGALLTSFGRAKFATRQVAVIGLAIVVAAGLTGQLGVAVPYASLVARWYVVPSQEARLVNQTEYTMMAALPKYVPKDDVVIANPGNGSAFAYAMSGTKMMFVHNIQTLTLDEQNIATHLGRKGWRNNVCGSVKRTRAYYYLYMGPGKIWNTSRFQFPGLPANGMNPEQGKQVVTIGDSVLYKITWCH